MANVETINREIDFWLEKQNEALQAVEFAERQIDRLLGAKALRLVGSEPPVPTELVAVPDSIA